MHEEYEALTSAEPEILAKAWPAAAPAERTLAKGLAPGPIVVPQATEPLIPHIGFPQINDVVRKLHDAQRTYVGPGPLDSGATITC